MANLFGTGSSKSYSMITVSALPELNKNEYEKNLIYKLESGPTTTDLATTTSFSVINTKLTSSSTSKTSNFPYYYVKSFRIGNYIYLAALTADNMPCIAIYNINSSTYTEYVSSVVFDTSPVYGFVYYYNNEFFFCKSQSAHAADCYNQKFNLSTLTFSNLSYNDYYAGTINFDYNSTYTDNGTIVYVLDHSSTSTLLIRILDTTSYTSTVLMSSSISATSQYRASTFTSLSNNILYFAIVQNTTYISIFQADISSATFTLLHSYNTSYTINCLTYNAIYNIIETTYLAALKSLYYSSCSLSDYSTYSVSLPVVSDNQTSYAYIISLTQNAYIYIGSKNYIYKVLPDYIYKTITLS